MVKQQTQPSELMKRISFLLFILCIATWCQAQTDSTEYEAIVDSIVHVPKYKVVKDTLLVNSRSFSKPIIDNFKADDDFRYGRPKQGLTPWQRFLIWLVGIINLILNILTDTTLGQIVFYGACFLLLLWVILKLLKIDARDLFYNRAGKNSLSVTGTENIHEVDFDSELQQSVADKKYREAVRLIFLFSLKKLSDAHLIQWVPGKTNDEYLLELRQHPSKLHLQNLRHYFEYAWYGHFEVTEQIYQHVAGVFQEFKSKLP